MERFDLVVIGGGSAGLKAARMAARAGRRVLVAEERELGGECFWAGCVPTKAMIRAAQVWHSIAQAARFGMHADVKDASFAEAMAYKTAAMRAVGGDGSGDGGLAKLGAKLLRQRATLEDAHSVRIGKEVFGADKIVLATGTVPFAPPIAGLKEAGYITNREAISLETLPKRIAVLGAGPIGLEFAQTFRRFGAQVTVIELGDRILPKEDADIAQRAHQCLEREGLAIWTRATVERVEREADAKRLTVSHHGEMKTLWVDEILVAAGRRAATEGMNLEAAGLGLTRGFLEVNRYLQTNSPHIFAPGDIHGGYLFTHVASYEGKITAQNAFGKEPKPVDYRVIPRCTYIDPEIASIGLLESEAEQADIPYRVLRTDFADMDRPILHGDAEGVAKILVDERDGQILGAHIIGHEASSLLGEIAVAMQNRLPISAIAATMHAYPSFPEIIEAAALSMP